MLQSINPVCTQLHTDNGKTSLHHVEITVVSLRSNVIYIGCTLVTLDVLTVGNTVNATEVMKQNCDLVKKKQ